MSKFGFYKELGKIFERFHSLLIFSRRTSILASRLASFIPPHSSVLDVGCGDGLVDRKILSLKPDLKITGADVFKRKKTFIPVTVFDGKRIPFKDTSYDVVLLIDTLHHTPEPSLLLKEASRVAKEYVIIKDHYLRGRISFFLLKLMDWVGNEAHDVSLPYNYLRPAQWERVFKESGLEKEREINSLGLYPFPVNLIFERKYHFIVRLKK